MHEVEIFDDFAYSNSLLSSDGSRLFNETNKLTCQIDNDGTLIKLLLIVLAFSTSSDVVLFQTNQNQLNNSTITEYVLLNTIYLYEIQNIYIEILFKYMLYRYVYDQAAFRFASLMKTFLYQSFLTASATDISIHESMIQTVIDKAEQSLILEDSLNDSTI